MTMRTLLFVGLLLLSNLLQAQTTPVEALDRARRIGQQHLAGTHDSVYVEFAAALQRKLQREQLQMIWKGLETQWGPLEAVGSIELRSRSPLQLSLPLRFARQQQRLLLEFDSANLVTSYLLQPLKEEDNWRYPAYGQRERYREFSMKVRTDTVVLPAILTLPLNCRRCPMVVMVHGFGPQDKDGSLGPNKIFKDLAIGLASRGIASLRYDKRSLAYGPELMEDLRRLTVFTETIDDAVSALALTRTIKEIDSSRIFLLGHGQGAMLAATIAAQSEVPVRGLLLLSASTQPMPDLIFNQYVHLAAENGFTTEERAVLREQEKIKQRALNPALPFTLSQDSLPLQLPASYWRSWQRIDLGGSLLQLPLPVWVAHGAADYQVPPELALSMKQKLMGRPKTTYRSFKGLNHFFMPSTGAYGPKDYEKRNNVAEEVIRDMDLWIREQLR